MEQKFSYYDVLGIIVPGVLVISFMCATIHWLGVSIDYPPAPEAIAVIVFTVLCLFTGYVVQALASLLEPFYFWSWGGSPSTNLLDGKTPMRNFSLRDAARIKSVLEAAIAKCDGVSAKLASADLFSFAISTVNHEPAGRVDTFNAIYAYHRGLVTALLLITLGALGAFLWSGLVGAVWHRSLGLAVLSCAVLTLLLWHRTKQRDYYYVREVLWMAGHLLCPRPSCASASPNRNAQDVGAKEA